MHSMCMGHDPRNAATGLLVASDTKIIPALQTSFPERTMVRLNHDASGVAKAP